MATTRKTTTKTASVSNEDLLAAINALDARFTEVINTAPVEDDEEVEDDEDEEEVELTQEMVDEATAEGIKSLRELASSVGIESTKKADILAEFEEMLGDEEDEEEDDEDDEEVEDDEDDEEDEDEDEEGLDRDDLEEMDLKELRKLAREEGHTAADYKGLDQDAIIDLILGEDEEEDEDEDDEEEEDDEDVEELDEDALKAMTNKDLLALAKELEIKVPAPLKKTSPATVAKKNKAKLVDLILDSGEDEE